MALAPGTRLGTYEVVAPKLVEESYVYSYTRSTEGLYLTEGLK
jgi:hypothetical protein